MTITIEYVAQLAALRKTTVPALLKELGLKPVSKEKENSTPKRVAGLHAGMVWMSEDFDAPLSDEFWLGVA